MSDSISTFRAESLAELNNVRDSDALDAWRIQFLGRRGAVGKLFAQISSLPQERACRFRPAA